MVEPEADRERERMSDAVDGEIPGWLCRVTGGVAPAAGT